MKSGARALAIADSTGDDRSVVCGCVTRADRVVDDFVFDTWTVGGTDATATVIDIFERLDREDVQYLLLSGIAPAWFNLLDCREIATQTGLPTMSVSYEASEGLEAPIREAFEDEDAVEERLAIYRRQPERRSISVNDEAVFLRRVGLDDDEAEEVVRAFTPEGGRPDPLRLANLAAHAAVEFFEG